MGIISWIIFGLIAGILAKWIMPGKDGGLFTVRYYHQPKCVPATATMAMSNIMMVVFLI